MLLQFGVGHAAVMLCSASPASESLLLPTLAPVQDGQLVAMATSTLFPNDAGWKEKMMENG